MKRWLYQRAFAYLFSLHQVILLTVHENKSFEIELTSTDPEVILGSNQTIAVAIKDQPKGSGSLSFLIILLCFFPYLRRKLSVNIAQ